MKKTAIIIVSAIVLIGGGIFAVSMLSSNNSGEDLTATDKVAMDIRGFAFSKADITVKKGTTVTWTNQDSAKHNATGDSSDGPKGELLARGESYSFTFDTVDTFDYLCQPHPYMKGKVNVVE